MSSMMEQSPEWMKYYEEEKRKLESLLESFVHVNEKSISLQSDATNEPSMEQYVKTNKQKIVQDLVKIRGKLHLQHEKILKAQQSAMIAAADLELKEKTPLMRHQYIKEFEKAEKEKFCALLRAVLLNGDTSKLYTVDESLRTQVLQTANQIKQDAEMYKQRKIEKVKQSVAQELLVMKAEKAAEVEKSSVNSENQLKKMIQDKMEKKRREIDVFISSLNAKRSLAPQDQKRLKLIEHYMSENMKLAAQITIMKHLNT